MSSMSVTRATLMKDLRMEWRQGRYQLHVVLLAAAVVIFSFAFNPTAEESRLIAGG